MKAVDNKVVSIEYTLTNDVGEVIDSSVGGDTFDYLHGRGNIVPGLERALTGRKIGDSLKVSIDPEDAYGVYDGTLTQVVPRSVFAADQFLEAGMQLQAHTDHGVQLFTIADVDEDEVTLDANHPLAGERLHFDVQICGIRDATAEELAHGHVHAESECC